MTSPFATFHGSAATVAPFPTTGAVLERPVDRQIRVDEGLREAVADQVRQVLADLRLLLDAGRVAREERRLLLLRRECLEPFHQRLGARLVVLAQAPLEHALAEDLVRGLVAHDIDVELAPGRDEVRERVGRGRRRRIEDGRLPCWAAHLERRDVGARRRRVVAPAPGPEVGFYCVRCGGLRLGSFCRAAARDGAGAHHGE
jgi:hypothetical protein